MTTIEELQQEEIEQLSQEEEIVPLELLITEGSELRVPITFDFPTKKGMKKVSAIIKPVTAVEWENVQQSALKTKKGIITKLLEKGLLDDNGEPVPPQLIKILPFGIANDLYMKIADISGLKQNREEQYQLTKDLLGF